MSSMAGARAGSQLWHEERVATTYGAIGVNAHSLRSPNSGPTVLIFGGVHGNEIGGIVAAGAITRTVTALKAGTVIVVPIAHEAAYAAFSRTGPADDGNLARSFPGRANGGPTQQLAALLGDRLIKRADILIDLHTSSPDADMPFFAGGLDDGSAAGDGSAALAAAFGAGIVWTHPAVGEGRTLTLARELGIPAIYVESPRGGVLNRELVQAYVAGVQRVLSSLDMLSQDVPPASAPSLWVHGDGDTDAFEPTPVDGLFVSEVGLLDAVVPGQLLGRVIDTFGRCLHEVVASIAGVVVTLRTTARITAGTPLIGLSAPRPAVLGLASDTIVRNGAATR